MSGTKSKRFIYKNSISWKEGKKGALSVEGKQKVDISTPPEFKGHPGMWSPEDLFVASVNGCIMTTFLFVSGRKDIGLISYNSKAEGLLERQGRQFMFSEVKVIPEIKVSRETPVENVKKIVLMTEDNCLISHSVKSKVLVSPVIEQEES